MSITRRAKDVVGNIISSLGFSVFLIGFGILSTVAYVPAALIYIFTGYDLYNNVIDELFFKVVHL